MIFLDCRPTWTTARHGCLPHAHDGRDSSGEVALPEFPAGPPHAVRRPNCAPAYYLGRPAHQWITAVRRPASTVPAADQRV
jgi:hypothetical protein